MTQPTATPPPSMFAELDQALVLVQAKKKALDDASAVVKAASEDYQVALKVAQTLHGDVFTQIAGILPGSHVRSS